MGIIFMSIKMLQYQITLLYNLTVKISTFLVGLVQCVILLQNFINFYFFLNL